MWSDKLKPEVSRNDMIMKLVKKIQGKSVYLFGAGRGGGGLLPDSSRIWDLQGDIC